MSIYRLLASSNYIVLNRDVNNKLGTNAAIMLAELADEEKFYERAGTIGKDGFFYSTIDNVEERTGLKRRTQNAGIKALKDSGILLVEVRGVPARRYFRLVPEALEALISEASSSLYKTDKLVCTECTNQNVQNEQSSMRKNDKLECTKSTNQNVQNVQERITNKEELKEEEQKRRTNKDISASAEEVIAYLNQKTGKHFRPSGNNAKLIHAREAEGYTIEDFKKVIDIKVNEWQGDSRMCKYLKPSTLFAPSHFDDYLNQPESMTAADEATAILNALNEEDEKNEKRNYSGNVVNARFDIREEPDDGGEEEPRENVGEPVQGSAGRDRNDSFFDLFEKVSY